MMVIIVMIMMVMVVVMMQRFAAYACGANFEWWGQLVGPLLHMTLKGLTAFFL